MSETPTLYERSLVQSSTISLQLEQLDDWSSKVSDAYSLLRRVDYISIIPSNSTNKVEKPSSVGNLQ
jgi:hypothetical protein